VFVFVLCCGVVAVVFCGVGAVVSWLWWCRGCGGVVVVVGAVI
jgi:hypothetical protein